MKAEDLDISDDDEIAGDVETEFTTRTEYVSCAQHAIDAVEYMDSGLMDSEGRALKERIVRKSLRIIDNIISELYDELFENEG